MTTSRFRASSLVTIVTIAAAVAAGTARLGAGQSKPFVRLTEAQIRAAAATSLAAAKNNDLTFENTMQKEIRKVAPQYENKSFKVYERAELLVTVQGPAQYVTATGTYRIKMAQPVEPLTVPTGITVNVSPLNEQAQDVVSVTVTRNGQEFKPTSVNLDLIEVSASEGMKAKETRKVHSGSATFPFEAFEPGNAKVEVSAVLDSGRKLSRTLVDSDLVKLQ